MFIHFFACLPSLSSSLKMLNCLFSTLHTKMCEHGWELCLFMHPWWLFACHIYMCACVYAKNIHQLLFSLCFMLEHNKFTNNPLPTIFTAAIIPKASTKSNTLNKQIHPLLHNHSQPSSSIINKLRNHFKQSQRVKVFPKQCWHPYLFQMAQVQKLYIGAQYMLQHINFSLLHPLRVNCVNENSPEAL